MQHNSLVSIISQALGGKPTPTGKPSGNQNDVTKGALTPEQAIGAINNILRF